jgi:hypothetical protein
MCRPPRIAANREERTARRSVPATFVVCVSIKSRLQGWHYAKSVDETIFLEAC